MNKRWLWILLGVIAFFVVLFIGAITGAGLTYLFLRVEPVKAAINFNSAKVIPANPDDGVLVMYVEPDSPVADAGIQRGDIILEVDGKPVNSSIELMEILESKAAGDEVSFTVKHCESTQELSVELEEQNGDVYTGLHPARTQVFSIAPGGGRLTQHLELGTAYLITKVISPSPAQEAGLMVGDMIIAVDGEEVQADENLADIVHAKKPGETLNLTISRLGDEDSRELTVNLAENPAVEDQAYLGVNYLRLSGFDGLPDGEFYFKMPEFEGQGIPIPQIPSDIFPFEHDFPQLPEDVKAAIVIDSVTPDSPADEAGLEPGDLITALDGESVSGMDSFIDSIHSLEPGDEITLSIYRSGEKNPLEVEIVLGEDPQEDGQAYLGVSITGFMHFEFGDTPTEQFNFQSETPFNFQFRFPWNSEPWNWESIAPPSGEDA